MALNRLFNRLLKAELLHLYDKLVEDLNEGDWFENFEKRYKQYQQYEEKFDQQAQQEAHDYANRDRGSQGNYNSGGQNTWGKSNKNQEQVYYDVLELQPGASFAEIKKAYRNMQKKYHPDRFANDPKKQELARRVSQKLNEAYSYFEKKSGKR